METNYVNSLLLCEKSQCCPNLTKKSFLRYEVIAKRTVSLVLLLGDYIRQCAELHYQEDQENAQQTEEKERNCQILLAEYREAGEQWLFHGPTAP